MVDITKEPWLSEWTSNNNLTIITPLKGKTLSENIEYVFCTGKYKNLKGTSNLKYIKHKQPKPSWRNLTNNAKYLYSEKLFKSRGFTILRSPIRIRKEDKFLLKRDVDSRLWETTIHNFERNRGPEGDKLSISRGEELVYVVLSYNSIPFEDEYPVKINGSYRRYDFYIPYANLYIEYHGEQHFNKVGNESSEQFLKRISSDKVKKQYVVNKGSYLMIPYNVRTLGGVTDILEVALGRKLNIPTESYINSLRESRLLLDKQIAEYYKENTREDTCKKFSVSKNTVTRAYKRVYGTSKKLTSEDLEYLKQDIIMFYLQNPLTKTSEKFSISYETVRKIFIETFGVDKHSFINKILEEEYVSHTYKRDRKERIAYYYLLNSQSLTVRKFGVSRGTVDNYFKEVFLETKQEIIKKSVTRYIERNKPRKEVSK